MGSFASCRHDRGAERALKELLFMPWFLNFVSFVRGTVGKDQQAESGSDDFVCLGLSGAKESGQALLGVSENRGP